MVFFCDALNEKKNTVFITTFQNPPNALLAKKSFKKQKKIKLDRTRQKINYMKITINAALIKIINKKYIHTYVHKRIFIYVCFLYVFRRSKKKKEIIM